MSNVIDLPNKEKEQMDSIVDSFNEEPMPEGKDGINVEMIKRGIKGGLSMLDKAIETYDADSGYPEMCNMMNSIQKTLKNMDEFIDMLQHDTVGVIKSMESSIAGQWTTQAHLQTLIETLKANAVVTDEELEQTWNKLIPSLMQDMQAKSPQ